MSRSSRQSQRGGRALRILRKAAKDFDYRVGGPSISEIDAFMDDIESGKIKIVEAHVLNMQPNKDYYENGAN